MAATTSTAVKGERSWKLRQELFQLKGKPQIANSKSNYWNANGFINCKHLTPATTLAPVAIAITSGSQPREPLGSGDLVTVPWQYASFNLYGYKLLEVSFPCSLLPKLYTTAIVSLAIAPVVGFQLWSLPKPFPNPTNWSGLNRGNVILCYRSTSGNLANQQIHKLCFIGNSSTYPSFLSHLITCSIPANDNRLISPSLQRPDHSSSHKASSASNEHPAPNHPPPQQTPLSEVLDSILSFLFWLQCSKNATFPPSDSARWIEESWIVHEIVNRRRKSSKATASNARRLHSGSKTKQGWELEIEPLLLLTSNPTSCGTSTIDGIPNICLCPVSSKIMI